MGIFGGLKPGDAERWGTETTFKTFDSEVLARALRPDQVVYCSPLVDPFQPAESERRAMEPILEIVAAHPPRIFVLQTRSKLVLEYLPFLQKVARSTLLRVSFSVTTDNDAVRKAFEPHCDSVEVRFETVRALVRSGINTFLALAPLLPCTPERLIDLALASTPNPLICDALHNRKQKPRGATTRSAAERVSSRLGYAEWHEPGFQNAVLERMKERAGQAGRRFATGPAGFSFLTEMPNS